MAEIDPIRDPLEALKDTGFEVDLSTWKMKQYNAWIKAAKAGDIDAMSFTMATVITAWPYEGNPAKVDSYEDLTPAEWKKAGEAVGSATTAVFQAA